MNLKIPNLWGMLACRRLMLLGCAFVTTTILSPAQGARTDCTLELINNGNSSIEVKVFQEKPLTLFLRLTTYVLIQRWNLPAKKQVMKEGIKCTNYRVDYGKPGHAYQRMIIDDLRAYTGYTCYTLTFDNRGQGIGHVGCFF